MPGSSSAGPVLLYVACGRELWEHGHDAVQISTVPRTGREGVKGNRECTVAWQVCCTGNKKKLLEKEIPGDRDIL